MLWLQGHPVSLETGLPPVVGKELTQSLMRHRVSNGLVLPNPGSGLYFLGGSRLVGDMQHPTAVGCFLSFDF